MSKLKDILKFTPIVLLALPMLGFGAAKLAGVPELHRAFHAMNLPTWFGYFIGAAEFAAGIGLLLPRWSALAATGLIPIMLGAAGFHIAFKVPSPLPALIFIALCVYIINLRRKDAIWYPF
ncbi:DoxX family protein [Shewanella sp. JM162201]|uniref:DoxX family protein n=1 Tax=Shewanella jiangmenensis TaxID=2837387 RepID=A0ABS5UZN1_9GAMM|nr:DoxX family protein [Shewanella jiangmenensis]MBT1443661.1 DoxX family protein [Shewanella jiangmenensis]